MITKCTYSICRRLQINKFIKIPTNKYCRLTYTFVYVINYVAYGKKGLQLLVSRLIDTLRPCVSLLSKSLFTCQLFVHFIAFRLTHTHIHAKCRLASQTFVFHVCVWLCVHQKKEIMCQSCAKRVLHFKIACLAPSNRNSSGQAPLHSSHLLTETKAEHTAIRISAKIPTACHHFESYL